MTWDGKTLAAMVAALLLVGCGTGAREGDYTPQRAYSADIDAARDHGPTASKPGMVGSEEPIGVLPWESDGSRQ